MQFLIIVTYLLPLRNHGNTPPQIAQFLAAPEVKQKKLLADFPSSFDLLLVIFFLSLPTLSSKRIMAFNRKTMLHRAHAESQSKHIQLQD